MVFVLVCLFIIFFDIDILVYLIFEINRKSRFYFKRFFRFYKYCCKLFKGKSFI